MFRRGVSTTVKVSGGWHPINAVFRHTVTQSGTMHADRHLKSRGLPLPSAQSGPRGATHGEQGEQVRIALARAQKPAPWVQAISVAAIGVVLASVFWGPVRPLAQLPLAEILTGTFVGSNGTADRLFELSGRENGQDVLWRTAAGDYWSNFWLLQVDVDDSRTNPVRTYAHVGLLAPDQMCAVIELLGSDVIIHTDDPAAEADLDELCGTLSYTVQVN
jgi:hypothetical protein